MTSDVGVMAAVIVMLALAVAASVAGVLGHGRALVTAACERCCTRVVGTGARRCLAVGAADGRISHDDACRCGLTSARRTGGPSGGFARAAATVGIPVGVVLSLVLLTRAVPGRPAR